MSESMTVKGFVATDPELKTTEDGLHYTRFRLAQTPRRFDRDAGVWVDGSTNWFSVTCFRELAVNAHASIRKGQPVLVSGRLRIKSFARADGTQGMSVEIDADTVGHDLRLGVGTFGRTHREAPSTPPMDPSQSQDSGEGIPGGGAGDQDADEEALSVVRPGEVLDTDTGVLNEAA